MAFFKTQTKTTKVETQIEWKNMTADKKISPVKKFVGFFEFDGKEHMVRYDGKFRSDAVTFFEDFARKNHGKFKSLNTLKN